MLSRSLEEMSIRKGGGKDGSSRSKLIPGRLRLSRSTIKLSRVVSSSSRVFRLV